ncbi:hypothetical protein, partial [Planococcus sp. SSTMD024]|uniref:hypothetical protein n=1 Tax=Planococcus sp. SSTMD024 TaxID=3242163 RepID=UPI00351EB98E
SQDQTLHYRVVDCSVLLAYRRPKTRDSLDLPKLISKFAAITRGCIVDVLLFSFQGSNFRVASRATPIIYHRQTKESSLFYYCKKLNLFERRVLS